MTCIVRSHYRYKRPPRKRAKVAAGVVVVVLLSATAPAPAIAQSDPYAGGVKQVLADKYMEQRQNFTDAVNYATFAKDCGAIGNTQLSMIVSHEMPPVQDAWLRMMRAFGPPPHSAADAEFLKNYPRLDFGILIFDASQLGHQQMNARGCDWFHYNPEAVEKLRQYGNCQGPFCRSTIYGQ